MVSQIGDWKAKILQPVHSKAQKEKESAAAIVGLLSPNKGRLLSMFRVITQDKMWQERTPLYILEWFQKALQVLKGERKLLVASGLCH